MRRAGLIATLVVGATALPAPAPAGAAAFTKFMSCDRQPLARSHLCPRDTRTEARIFAAFRSNREDAFWKPCARYPTGRLSCAPVQRARRGRLYTLSFTTSRLGRFKFFWVVDGRRLPGTWNVRIKR
jgi:hypothetical protein